MLIVTVAAWPMTLTTSVVGQTQTDLPVDQWLLMQQVAANSGCGLDWSILAGLEKEETDFGRNPDMYVPHNGGIVGIVQMQPGNWAIFAPPGGDPFNQHDALTAAARYLCASGAGQDIRAGAVCLQPRRLVRRRRPALGAAVRRTGQPTARRRSHGAPRQLVQRWRRSREHRQDLAGSALPVGRHDARRASTARAW